MSLFVEGASVAGWPFLGRGMNVERDPHERMVGREGLLARARARLADGGSVLLPGPAGIGKSTVLRALAAEFTAAGELLLRCSPTESEAQLPFLALIDALGPVVGEVADALPASQRSVLDAALTGRPGSVEPGDGLALRLAVLSVVRALAARSPVLLVADDMQWVDAPSAELLAFVARRVGGLPFRMVGALRTETTGERPDGDGAPDLDRHLRALPPPALVLRVPPLTPSQTSELLGRRRRPALPGAVLREVHRASGGNPLFALELGRALAELETPPRPGDPLPVPTSLRTLVLDRLRTLPPAARTTLLLAAAGARPTVALLRAAGRADAEAHLAEAARLGVVEADHEPVVRFTHPIVSAALYAEAPARDRRGAHAALARAADDPIERARHAALATVGRDGHVADALARAAGVARERGAPATAARLGLLAAERTPEHDPRATGRRLDAAEDALVAGEPEVARQTAREVLDRAARPADRVRAWIAVIDSAGQAMADVDDVFPQALADAGDDPALLAPLHYQLAWRALLAGGSLPRARTEAATAARLAADSGDRRTELLALSFQAHTEMLMGHQDAGRTLAAALAAPQDPRVACDHNGPGYIHFRRLLTGDRLDEARVAVAELARLAEQRGAVEGQMLFLRGLAETELRAGRCAAALERAYDSLRLARDAGVGEGPIRQVVALAEAAGGSVSRAVTLAEDAVRRAEEDGDVPYLARGLHALGHATLTGGDAATAVPLLRRAREMELAQGIADPAQSPGPGDLAEALVAVGERDEARRVVAGARAAARRLRRVGVLAVLDRAEGLLRAANGDPEGAAESLRAAARTLGRLGYRLEEGRAELALGQLELDRGDPVAGRAALDAAARTFRRAKAGPWLERAVAAQAAAEGDGRRTGGGARLDGPGGGTGGGVADGAGTAAGSGARGRGRGDGRDRGRRATGRPPRPPRPRCRVRPWRPASPRPSRRGTQPRVTAPHRPDCWTRSPRWSAGSPRWCWRGRPTGRSRPGCSSASRRSRPP
ncbi:AAA family ATPase [Streptomyces pactum]|uniref:AAA family ATPase n=1 Tax=Streptomyces pactum TaxID=68249 RepID=UPI0027DE0354|nr:AAA family ATPase [Streptomyces pactum]